MQLLSNVQASDIQLQAAVDADCTSIKCRRDRASRASARRAIEPLLVTSKAYTHTHKQTSGVSKPGCICYYCFRSLGLLCCLALIVNVTGRGDFLGGKKEIPTKNGRAGLAVTAGLVLDLAGTPLLGPNMGNF